MTSFNDAEKAVRLKVDHLKDKAKLGTLADSLQKEFTSVKSTLQNNKNAITTLVKGFHDIQIHHITKNVEVKEASAKQELEGKINDLITILKNSAAQPALDTTTETTDDRQTESAPAQTAASTATSAPAPAASTTSESRSTADVPPPPPASTPEAAPAAVSISPEVKQQAKAALEDAKKEMQNFNPKSKDAALAQFPEIERKLETIISLAAKTAAELPAGADKTEMEKIQRSFEGYKAELIKQRGILKKVPALFFGGAIGELNNAKQDAASLIARFEAVLNK